LADRRPPAESEISRIVEKVFNLGSLYPPCRNKILAVQSQLFQARARISGNAVYLGMLTAPTAHQLAVALAETVLKSVWRDAEFTARIRALMEKKDPPDFNMGMPEPTAVLMETFKDRRHPINGFPDIAVLRHEIKREAEEAERQRDLTGQVQEVRPADRPPEQMDPLAMAIAFMYQQGKRTGKLPTIPEVLQAVPKARRSTLYGNPAFKAARKAIKQSLCAEIPKGHRTQDGRVEASDE
jgi:hypothetical protein